MTGTAEAVPLCVVCGSVAEARCAWPTPKPVRIQVADLTEEDAVLFRDRSYGGRWDVMEIRKHGPSVTVVLMAQGRSIDVLAYANDSAVVERVVPCAAPVCDLHLQERAPGLVVCRDHWRAWEAVA